MIRDVIGVHMEELATHWQEDSRTVEACEDEKSFSAKSSGRYSLTTPSALLLEVNQHLENQC